MKGVVGGLGGVNVRILIILMDVLIFYAGVGSSGGKAGQEKFTRNSRIGILFIEKIGQTNLCTYLI